MRPSLPPFAYGVALLLVGIKLAVHIVASLGDGWFRDELYYVVCSDRLAFGYVDHPPASIVVLAMVRMVTGDSLMALRIAAALMGALTMVATGLLARELSGSRFAQSLAMLATLVSPIVLGVNSFYSMNSLEILLWATAALVFARLLTQPTLARWIIFGVVVGFGLLNKISMSWFIGGIGIGLLLAPQRRMLATAGPWIAALVAALLFAPHVWWQTQHGFATVEFMRRAAGEKMIAIAPLAFLANQVVVVGPQCALIAAAGLVALLIWPRLRLYRPLGWMYVLVTALLVVNRASRANYLAPAYAPLIAAGSTFLESASRSHASIRTLILVLVAAVGIVIAPLALPILPPDASVSYAAALGLGPQQEEKDARGALPQHLSDRFGWDAVASAVGDAYRSLPPEDRRVAGIFAGNYGEAGAIDVLGKVYGLPPAISGHNNYWLWGTRGQSGDIMIVVGVPKAQLVERFESVEQVGETRCRWCRPFENGQAIYVCRKPKRPLSEMWPELKKYI